MNVAVLSVPSYRQVKSNRKSPHTQHEVHRLHHVDSGGTWCCTLGFFESGAWNQHRASPAWSCGLYPILHLAPIPCQRDPTVLFPSTLIPFLFHPSLGSSEGFYRGTCCSWCCGETFQSGTSRSASIKRQQSPAKWITLSRQHFPWKTGQERSYHIGRLCFLKWSSVITSALKKMSAEHLQMDFSCSSGLFPMVSTRLARTTSHGRHLLLSSGFSFACFSHPTKLATEATAVWRGAGRATGLVIPLDIPAKLLSDRLQHCWTNLEAKRPQRGSTAT